MLGTDERDDRRVSSVAKFFADAKEMATSAVWLLRVMATPGPVPGKLPAGLPWPLSWLSAQMQRRQMARTEGAVRREEPRTDAEPAEARVRVAIEQAAPCWEYEKEVCTVRVKWPREAEVEGPFFIESPEDACAVARSIFAKLDCDQEHFVLLGLDSKNALTGYKVVASGTLHAVDVDFRKFFRSALHLGASQVIAVHNHPSGRALPSVRDMLLTRRLAHAGDIVGIGLIEHIIWTPREWLPLKELHAELFLVPGYPRA